MVGDVSVTVTVGAKVKVMVIVRARVVFMVRVGQDQGLSEG